MSEDEEKEILQKLSERICGAHTRKIEFLQELDEMMKKYPIEREIKYDFRDEPIQEST